MAFCKKQIKQNRQLQQKNSAMCKLNEIFTQTQRPKGKLLANEKKARSLGEDKA